jgi:uncharacterized phage-associated protein
MAHHPFAIANTLLEFARADGTMLGIRKLVNLVYFAHGWSLAVYGGPLLDEPVEACEHGVMLPSFRELLASHRDRPIEGMISRYCPDRRRKVAELLDPFEHSVDWQLCKAVWKQLGSRSPAMLDKASHEAGTPWDVVWSSRPAHVKRGLNIPDEIIRVHFELIRLAQTHDGNRVP